MYVNSWDEIKIVEGGGWWTNESFSGLSEDMAWIIGLILGPRWVKVLLRFGHPTHLVIFFFKFFFFSKLIKKLFKNCKFKKKLFKNGVNTTEKIFFSALSSQGSE